MSRVVQLDLTLNIELRVSKFGEVAILDIRTSDGKPVEPRLVDFLYNQKVEELQELFFQQEP